MFGIAGKHVSIEVVGFLAKRHINYGDFANGYISDAIMR